LLKPTDRLDFLLSYQHTYNRAIGSSSQISNLGPLAGNGVQGAGNPIGGVTFGTDQRASYSSDPRLHNGDDINSARGDMITGTAHYDLGAATITSITSAAWAKSLAALDFDFDNKDATTVFRYERYNQFTQELRLASNDTSSALQYLAGLYYFQSNFHTVDEYYYGIPDFPPAFLNLGVPPGQLFNGNYDVRFDQHTKSVSGFGQVIWKPIERLTVNVGGRYSHETKHVSIGGDILPGPVTLWNTVVNAPFPYQRLKPVVDNLVSASAALQYQFTGDVMGYAAFSRSGKSGGYGDLDTFGFDGVTFYNGAPAGNPQKQAAIGKERSNSYEIGFKTRLLDRRMTFNAAAFLMDLFGLQQLVFSPAGAFISSNDRVRAKGFEGSIEYQPLPDISMGISATYSDVLNLDTRQRIAQSPRLSGTAHLDYGHDVSNDLRLSVGAAVRHRSSKYNQLGEAEPDGPFTTLGLHARLESRGGWYLNADAENVTNAHGADFGYPGPDPFVGSFKSTAPLRTIWLTAGYKF
jgi:iron complex outermembrane receptor protein